MRGVRNRETKGEKERGEEKIEKREKKTKSHTSTPPRFVVTIAKPLRIDPDTNDAIGARNPWEPEWSQH